MATVTVKAIVDEIIRGNGYYPEDDLRVIKIVQYNNQFDGGIAWGLIYQGEDPLRYHKAPACHNPKTIWAAEGVR